VADAQRGHTLIVAGFFQQVFDRITIDSVREASAKPSAGGFANTISRITKSCLAEVYIDRPSWSVMRPIRPLKLRIDRRYNADSSHARWLCPTPRRFHPMSDFVLVAKVSDLPDPGKMLVEVEDRLVVLFHCGGSFRRSTMCCTHGRRAAQRGALDCQAGTIACPRHGAKFDIKNGAAVTMPATHATEAHEVKVEGDQVFVRLCD